MIKPARIRLDFPGIQTRLLPEEERLVMRSIHDADTLTMGPHLKKLEASFSKYHNIPYSVGVSNCTAALELAAMVLDIRPDDEVIIPAHTFTASAIPFLRSGAKIVFVDIEPRTFVMASSEVKRAITRKTKAIVSVHLYGLMAPMREVMSMAKEKGIVVIEDVAQAPGASIDGRKSGTWGDIACFSFHSQKNITALGEGGMLVTAREDLYEKLLGLRKIGSRPYENQTRYWKPAMANMVEVMPGKVPYNFALPEPNACAANLILGRLDTINSRRREQAGVIMGALAGFPELEFQQIPEGYIHAYHLLVARYRSDAAGRDDLIELLYSKYGIKCVVQYNPLYNYDLFVKNGYTAKTCPLSDDFFNNMISFPFWSDMPEADIKYLIDSVLEALKILRSR